MLEISTNPILLYIELSMEARHLNQIKNGKAKDK